MRVTDNPDIFTGAAFMGTVTTPPLKGLGRMHGSIVQMLSGAGVVTCNLLAGENTTNEMTAVTC